MKKTCVLMLIVVSLVWGGGCSTAPEHLDFGTADSDVAEPRSSLGTRFGAGSVDGGFTGSLVVQGFAVLGFRATRDEHGRVFVVGEVKNVGQATQGVELQVTLRDRADRAIAVRNFCPGANHSIAPNDTRPFAYAFGRQEGGVRAELRIIRTFYTMDTLGLAALVR
jgi:hypothetical protein